MDRHSYPTLRACADAIMAMAAALLLRWLLWPILQNHLPFLTFLPAVVLCAYLNGARGGLIGTALGTVFTIYLMERQSPGWSLNGYATATGLGLYVFSGVIISLLYESLQRAQQRAESQSDRLQHSEARQRVTLSSIADGVIVTAADGRITLINPVAQNLTSWTAGEANGQALGKVFRIFEEGTELSAEDPVARTLQEGQIRFLAKPTELLGKDNSRKPIGGSAAVIREDGGAVTGVVLVFRDITERRRLERQRDSSMLRHQKARAEAETARRQAVQILESITDGFFAVDRSWRFTYINSLAEQLLGRKREDLLGKHLWEEFPESLPSGLGRVYRRAMADAATVIHEEYYSPHGRWYEVHAYGSAEGLSVYFRDSTERRQSRMTLSRSEDRYRCLVRATAQMVWTTDENGLIVEDSPSWRSFTGQTLEQWLGKGWLDAVHPDDRACAAAAWSQAISNRSIYETEYRLRTVDGGYRYTSARAVPVLEPDGSIREWVGMNTDITDRKRAEEEQERAEEALREVARRKDEFLAMLGHELRNPLAPIRNALQILHVSHAADSDVGRLTNMMERQIAHMVRLVEDLLDVSRISRGKIELIKAPVDLTELADRTAEALRPTFEERRQQLELSLPAEPLRLQADAARLEQVLNNLLTNAAKYTPVGGLIRLGLRREGDEAVITVADNGIGIRPEMLARIFDTFQQADRLPGHVSEGLGLGLTLVRKLTEMHGGRVVVFSPGPGCGSEFVVRLPLIPVEEPVAPPKDKTPPNRTAALPSKVLVVDDNVDGAASLAMVLRMTGHAVEIAHDGPEALGLACQSRPEIVLLDIGLPNGMDGYEVARRLRSECGLENVLLVAVTGYGQEEDRLRAQEAGFDAHLTKPVDFEDLNELLSEAAKMAKTNEPT